MPEAGHDQPVRSAGPSARSAATICWAAASRLRVRHETGSTRPPVGAAGEHGRLLEVVVVQREDRAVDRSVEPMPGAADPLDEPADLVRGTELDDVVDGADVDPELERGCGDERPEPAIPERALGLLSHLPRERPVMDGDREVGRQSVEAGREPLRGGPRVDEDEGRPVRADLAPRPPEAPSSRGGSAFSSRRSAGSRGVARIGRLLAP